MLKATTRNLVSVGIMGLLLFLPAGTFAWPQAWLFLVMFSAWSLAIGLWLMKTDPDLLQERMKSPLSEDQKPRDRMIMWAILVFFALWLAFMALDARRFVWSHVPVGAQAIGAVLIAGAFLGWAQVLRANRFAATTIRIQTERSQRVISSGPYAVVRHPMYAYVLLLLTGTPLLLGSLWGLVGVVVAVPLMGARALGEEALLMDGLPGYRDYAAKVRFRLVPGVW